MLTQEVTHADLGKQNDIRMSTHARAPHAPHSYRIFLNNNLLHDEVNICFLLYPMNLDLDLDTNL